jgi:hypothetical protein
MNHVSSQLIAAGQIDDRLREAERRRLANLAKASKRNDSTFTRIGRLIERPGRPPRPSRATQISGW